MTISSRTRKGLVLAALHVAIVASLGAKLLIDRAIRPRAWARVAPIDPDMPIRGRYLRLELEAPFGAGFSVPAPNSANANTPNASGYVYGADWFPIGLDVRDHQLVAVAPPAADAGSNAIYARADPLAEPRTSARTVRLIEPVVYFIPEHIDDPSQRPKGEELWAEVTIPRHGAPRPIRLGVKKNGVLTPLDVR
jgi:hypothetical protein